MEASPSSGPYWMHWNAFEDVVAITWATAAAPEVCVPRVVTVISQQAPGPLRELGGLGSRHAPSRIAHYKSQP